MAYLKINNTDFSQYVNSLKVNKINNYISKTNALGNTVIDKINQKVELEVGIIPLDSSVYASLGEILEGLEVSVEYRDPTTEELSTALSCIIPDTSLEYYTIRTAKTSFKAFTFKILEL